jgi:monoterpene epsilon-lactone hydrolase
MRLVTTHLVPLALLAIAGTLTISERARGQESVDPRSRVPAVTISAEWRTIWQTVILGMAHAPEAPPNPHDLPAWAAARAKGEAALAPLTETITAQYRVTVAEQSFGDVPVLSVSPNGWTDDGRILIYVHGGGFTSLSARSTLFESALMANRSGLRVISVDYTVAPQARWPRITDQAISVYKAILATGYRPGGVGMWGDSAGGAIVAGSVLKLRDAGVAMPGAVVLWAPWSDISMAGDSYTTLAAFDPLLNDASLKASADAYAEPSEQKNPYVSPVYGDYSKGFPPTLIQGGTREIFLSNAVRQYQALSQAGIPATLDLYEGMPHVFQPMGPETPEGQAAMGKVVSFWKQQLRAKAPVK